MSTVDPLDPNAMFEQALDPDPNDTPDWRAVIDRALVAFPLAQRTDIIAVIAKAHAAHAASLSPDSPARPRARKLADVWRLWLATERIAVLVDDHSFRENEEDLSDDTVGLLQRDGVRCRNRSIALLRELRPTSIDDLLPIRSRDLLALECTIIIRERVTRPSLVSASARAQRPRRQASRTRKPDNGTETAEPKQAPTL